MRRKSRQPYTHVRHGKLYVRVPYQAQDGRWRSKERHVDSIRDVPAAIAEIQNSLREPAQMRGEDMTFTALVAEFEQRRTPLATWYRAPFLAAFGTLKIQQITYQHLDDYRRQRAATPTPAGKPREVSTLNRELEKLRTIFHYAVRCEWLTKSPFDRGPSLIKTNEETHRYRILTPDEEARLLAVCINERAHLKGLVLAAIDTGLRRGALITLRWQDLDFERGLIAVPKSKAVNKKRPGFVGMTERLRAELLAVREQDKPKPEDLIFGITNHFRRAWNTACRLANLPGLHFHDLRHCYVTKAVAAGVPQTMAMRLVGHTQAETFHRYLNPDERIALEVARALDRHDQPQPEPVNSLVN